MMKSMDELREEIRILKQNHIDTDELTRIADAIEREIDSYYMRLPRDKDGVPVRVGDEMVYVRPSGTQIHRCVKYVSPDGFAGFEDRVGEEAALAMYVASFHHHYEPPTVERVLENALNEAAMLDRKEGYWPSAADIANILNELAPKLQLREEDDE